MRNKTHLEFIDRWAEFIKNKPQDEWRPKFNEFIDAQFKIAQRVRENLKKSEEGREALRKDIERRRGK